MYLVDAFVACGGSSDKSGIVHKDTLIKIIKQDFGLTINIEVPMLTSTCPYIYTNETLIHQMTGHD